MLIADHAGRALIGMSPDGRFDRELRLRSRPDALTLGPDGDVWYVPGDEGTIRRVRWGH